MTDAADETNSTNPPAQAEPAIDRAQQAISALKTAGDNGANWFFWIAGLSLANTVILHSGGDTHFIVGLGVTFIVDAIASVLAKQNPEASTPLMVFAIGFSVVVSLVAVLFGWLSRKRMLWVFGIGMFFYTLDGLLYLWLQDYLSAGFHGFALYSMSQGFRSYRLIPSLESAMANVATETESQGETNRETNELESA